MTMTMQLKAAALAVQLAVLAQAAAGGQQCHKGGGTGAVLLQRSSSVARAHHGGGHFCDCIPLEVMGICADPSMTCGEFTACIDSKFTKPDGSALPYPADYGSTCKKHKDPGSAACYNLTTGEELPPDQQKQWCKDPWCFVNPCTCTDGRAQVTITDPASCCKSGTGGDITTAYTYANCVPGTQDTWIDSTSLSMFPPGDLSLWEDNYGTCPDINPKWLDDSTCAKGDKEYSLRAETPSNHSLCLFASGSKKRRILKYGECTDGCGPKDAPDGEVRFTKVPASRRGWFLLRDSRTRMCVRPQMKKNNRLILSGDCRTTRKALWFRERAPREHEPIRRQQPQQQQQPFVLQHRSYKCVNPLDDVALSGQTLRLDLCGREEHKMFFNSGPLQQGPCHEHDQEKRAPS